MLTLVKATVPALCLMIAGGVFMWQAKQYGLGSLARMQTGYFPFVASAALMGFAAVLVITEILAWKRTEAASVEAPLVDASGEEVQVHGFDWRSLVFVGLGLVAFALSVPVVGLLPACALLAFISAFAMPGTRPAELAAITVGGAVLAYVIFAVGLQVTVPLIGGRF